MYILQFALLDRALTMFKFCNLAQETLNLSRQRDWVLLRLDDLSYPVTSRSLQMVCLDI